MDLNTWRTPPTKKQGSSINGTGVYYQYRVMQERKNPVVLAHMVCHHAKPPVARGLHGANNHKQIINPFSISGYGPIQERVYRDKPVKEMEKNEHFKL